MTGRGTYFACWRAAGLAWFITTVPLLEKRHDFTECMHAWEVSSASMKSTKTNA